MMFTAMCEILAWKWANNFASESELMGAFFPFTLWTSYLHVQAVVSHVFIYRPTYERNKLNRQIAPSELILVTFSSPLT